MIAFSFWLSGVGAFLLLKQFVNRFAAFCAALVYVFYPYHLAEIFMRGDVAEAIAGYTWIPFAFYFAVRFIRELKIQYLIFSAAFLSAVIFTHALSGLIWVPVFSLFVLLLAWQEKMNLNQFKWLVGGGVLSVGLSAFYAFPALFESALVYADDRLFNSPHIPVLHQVPDLLSLKYTSVSYFQSPYEFIEVAPITLGFVLIFIVAALQFFSKNIEVKTRGILRFWVIAFGICGLLIASPALNGIWNPENFPVLYMLQFPWRLGMIMALAMTVFVGILVQTITCKTGFSKLVVLGFIGNIIWMGAFPYLKETTWGHEEKNPNYLKSYFWVRDLNHLATPEISPAYSSTLANEYAPRTVPVSFDQSRKAVAPADYKKLHAEFPGQLKTKFLKKNGAEFNFKVENLQTQKVWMEHYYLPGWTAFVEGQKIATYYNQNGLIAFRLPVGEYHLQVKFVETPLRSLAQYLSLGALFIAIMGLCFRRRINQLLNS